MRLLWCNDLHFDFIGFERLMSFADEMANALPDAVLIGGDTSTADRVMNDLECLADRLQRPIYFVLGNHDYYMGSIERVREHARELSEASIFVTWLANEEAIKLTPRTSLIGHGGWGDARYGDFMASPVMLNDYIFIEELAQLSKQDRMEKLNALGDEAAAHVSGALSKALTDSPEVIFLTHVPPFREACVHEGKPSNDDWAPHFSCKAVGGVLLEIMDKHPDQKLTVLSGHTHGSGCGDAAPNIRWITGGAVYRQPRIQDILEIE